MRHLLRPSHLYDAPRLLNRPKSRGRVSVSREETGRGSGTDGGTSEGAPGMGVGEVVDHVLLDLGQERIEEYKVLERVQPRVLAVVVH